MSGVSGRRWSRPEPTHPEWCVQGHRCDAHARPDGQHRSAPVTVDTPYGRLVYTQVQPRQGRRLLELRVVVELDEDPQVAAVQATQVTAGVDAAIRSAVRGSGHRPIGSAA